MKNKLEIGVKRSFSTQLKKVSIRKAFISSAGMNQPKATNGSDRE
jgi:hypothetical protein